MKIEATSEEMEALRESSENVFFPSYYKFLSNHNGFRKKNIHVFLGTSHGGKSTLVRSLILDLCLSEKPKPVLLILSEESVIEFMSEFFRSGIDPDKFTTLYVISEIDEAENFGSAQAFMKYVENYAIEKDIELLFFDNITTSICYMDRTPQEQAIVSIYFKKLAARLDLPVILIAHTGAQCTDNMNRLIEMNDIRGGKTLVNLAHFFYIMQNFHSGNIIASTIRICKHRGQDVVDKFYKLIYIPKARVYAKDERISFSDVKEIFKNRNKL